MMPLFTDIWMSGMSGLELIKNLKDAFSRALLIVVSGYAEYAFAQRAVAYGAFGYYLKPFDDNENIGYLKKSQDDSGKPPNIRQWKYWISLRKIMIKLGKVYARRKLWRVSI